MTLANFIVMFIMSTVSNILMYYLSWLILYKPPYSNLSVKLVGIFIFLLGLYMSYGIYDMYVMYLEN